MNVLGKHVPHQSASPALERTPGFEPGWHGLEGRLITEIMSALELPPGVEPGLFELTMLVPPRGGLGSTDSGDSGNRTRRESLAKRLCAPALSPCATCG